MKFFTPRRRTLLFAGMLALGAAFASNVFAQEAAPDVSAPAVPEADAVSGPPKIAVYLTGDAPDDKKKTIGTRLLVALVKTGRYGSIDRPAEFTAAADSARAAQPGAATAENGVYAAAAEFGAGFVCMTDVAALADEYQIFARVIDAKTARVVAIGDFYGPIKTAADLKPALDELVETMFPTPKEAPPAAAPQQAQAPAADASTADATVAAVSVTGEAKAAVDRVVAAVNAFKDATSKSIAAANAVKTATQSRNFSAIKDAKQKVESAAEAVKKAKADVTAAIDALNSSGPEAGAAVKAMGIDLSMFGGTAGGAGDEAAGGEDGGEADTRFYFTPKYQSPVGTPVSWGGVNAEIGWVWTNGLLLGIDVGFGMDGAGLLAGGGLSLGREYDFKNQMQIVYGTAAGFWYLDHGYRNSYNFIAPFVKYRWNSYEVTYRGLMGTTYGGKFGYNSHQTMVGYYMEKKAGGGGEKRADNDDVDKSAHFYFAPKYQLPVWTPVSWGGVNAEFGWVWGNGFLLGIDLNYGGDIGDYRKYPPDDIFVFGGIGLNLGKVFDFAGAFTQIAVGGSVGCWVSASAEWDVPGSGDRYYSLKGLDSPNGLGLEYYKENISYNFLAPFVRLRVSVVEIMYRGFLGIYNKKETMSFNSGTTDGTLSYDIVKPGKGRGFGYNSQQLMVGFNFGGMKNR